MTNYVKNIQGSLEFLQLPYEISEVTPGDGNCFFHAIISQLHFQNDYTFDNHLQLRKKLVLYMATNARLNENPYFKVAKEIYIEEKRIGNETDKITWQRLLNHMNKSGTWIEDIFINGCASFLDRTIKITSNTQTIIFPWHSIDPLEKSKKWRFPLTLATIPHIHFQSIVPKKVCTSTCLGCGKLDLNMVEHIKIRSQCSDFVSEFQLPSSSTTANKQHFTATSMPSSSDVNSTNLSSLSDNSCIATAFQSHCLPAALNINDINSSSSSDNSYLGVNFMTDPNVKAIECSLKNLQLPYRITEITPGDGNCFFHALISQLHHQEDYTFENHLQLRKKLVSYVANNATLNANSVFKSAKKLYIKEKRLKKETYKTAWEKILANMNQSGTWVDDIFILACANFLERIIKLTSDKHTLNHPWNSIEPFKKPNQWTFPLTLAIIPHTHFQSIVPKEIFTTTCLGCGKRDLNMVEHIQTNSQCSDFVSESSTALNINDINMISSSDNSCIESPFQSHSLLPPLNIIDINQTSTSHSNNINLPLSSNNSLLSVLSEAINKKLLKLKLPYYANLTSSNTENNFWSAIFLQLNDENKIKFKNVDTLLQGVKHYLVSNHSRLQYDCFQTAKTNFISTIIKDTSSDNNDWNNLIQNVNITTCILTFLIYGTALYLNLNIFITSSKHTLANKWTSYIVRNNNNNSWKGPLLLYQQDNQFIPIFPSFANDNECLGCGKTYQNIYSHIRRVSTCHPFYDMVEIDKIIANKKLELQRQRRVNKRAAPKPLPYLSSRPRIHDTAMSKRYIKFKENIKYGPTFPCLCCERLMFENSMCKLTDSEFNEYTNTLEKLYKQTWNKCNKAINGKYYICSTCKSLIKQHKRPPQCFLNGLHIEEVDVDLQLNELERTLIAKNILFLKLLQLPKSRWNALKDRVINVPIADNDLLKSLNKLNQFPRNVEDAGLLPVLLKRNLSFKSAVLKAHVNPDNLIKALKYLQKMKHPSYADIVIDCNYTITSDTSEIDITENLENAHIMNENENVENAATLLINNQPEIDMIHQISSDQPVSLAPGEDKIPANIMRDDHWDINAFPLFHPSGKYGLNYPRSVKLSAQKYFNQRILNRNQQFTNYAPWVFSALYYIERQQLESQVNISYRKGKFIDNKILQIDDAFNVFQKISGTPKYWLQKRYEIMARLEQLGPFHFFFTLSCADKRWTETLTSLFNLKGYSITWTNKSDFSPESILINDIPLTDFLKDFNLHNLIKENILLLTRSFDRRVHTFLKYIVMDKSSPMKTQFYNYRVEFQMRGAAHIHGVLWVDLSQLENRFPNIQEAFNILKEKKYLTDRKHETLVNFIDSYISVSLNTDIRETIEQVQIHYHTPACKKKQVFCRFDYPKLPSEKTFISYKLDQKQFPTDEDYFHKRNIYLKVVNQIKAYLINLDRNDLHLHTLDSILKHNNISKELYYESLKYTSRGTSVVLKRNVDEIYVNNYNYEWLKAWDGNLDIQLCLDYFAILTYITDYYSKDDQGTIPFLKEAVKQCEEGDLKSKMKCLSQAFLTHRQIGESEAYYRMLPNLHLSESNINCIFLTNGFPDTRSRFLFKLDPENISPNMIHPDKVHIDGKQGSYILKPCLQDKYALRSDDVEDLCFAAFAMFYDSVKKIPKQENNQEFIQNKTLEQYPSYIILKKNGGFVKKRNFPHILRYHQIPIHSHFHEYLYSELLFFLPWRDEETEFYPHDWKACQDVFNKNHKLIETNKDKLFPHKNNLQKARELYKEMSKIEDSVIADNLDSTNEQDNIECSNITIEAHTDFRHLDPNFVEKNKFNLPEKTKYKRIDISNIDAMLESARKLCYEQRLVFDSVLQYCKSIIKNEQHPKKIITPPLIMIHGSAGTGKSKLIQDISQWCEHTLTRSNNRSLDQPYIIRVAPTGKAASIIGGLTLHSAFNFKFSNEFTSLNDKNRNATLTMLEYLTVLIIDEISMVKSDMLYQLHLRLQEIKQNQKLFGGVSILMFGDLMQLKPVKGQWIFESPASEIFAQTYKINNLWRHFEIIELRKNHRQGEDERYADLLNRIRFGKQINTDILLLQSRIVNSVPAEYLHVFGTNKLVNNHNQKMLENTPGEKTIFRATHMHPTVKTFKPPINEHGQVADTPFMNILELKINSKIMLIYNVDTADALTNGALGTVKKFLKKGDSVTHILIQFSDPDVGKYCREQLKHLLYPNDLEYTPISLVCFAYNLGKPGQKKTCTIQVLQFPLKLAWAITAHKIQGQTIRKPNALVADINSTFTAGQAYVIFSRVQSLNQLYLKSFSEKKITISTAALKESQAMTERCVNDKTSYWSTSSNDTKITTLNIRSLNKHYKDILVDSVVLLSDIICLSETHLYSTQTLNHFNIPNYNVIHACQGKGKGVALYYNNKFNVKHVNTTATPTFQIILALFQNLQIILIYRQQQSQEQDHNLLQWIQNNLQENITTLICGDFNIPYNLQPNNIFSNEFKLNDMQQQVEHATHKHGNILDHIYCKNSIFKNCFIHSVYYSDHEAICFSIETK